MKKYLLIAILFLLPCFAFAQSKKSIDSFMDIPFGSDPATVKAAVFAKGGVIKNDPSLQKNSVVYTHFSMSQRQVNSLYVNFVDNKAYSALFFFVYNEELILSSYEGLVADLTAIYGKPQEADNFNDLSNTNKLRKLKLGNITIKTLWQSKNKNTITVRVMPVEQSLQLVLGYEDSALFKLNASKRQSDL